MEHHRTPPETIPLNLAARCLRVPALWLRAEIEAGRIPGLVAGRKVLVHIPTVSALLTKRAQEGTGLGVTDSAVRGHAARQESPAPSKSIEGASERGLA